MGYIYGIVPSIFEEGACICQFHLCRLEPALIDSDEAAASSEQGSQALSDGIKVLSFIVKMVADAIKTLPHGVKIGKDAINVE